jgi:hypothetical protein
MVVIIAIACTKGTERYHSPCRVLPANSKSQKGDKISPNKGFSSRSDSILTKEPEAARDVRNPKTNANTPKIRTTKADSLDIPNHPLKNSLVHELAGCYFKKPAQLRGHIYVA